MPYYHTLLTFNFFPPPPPPSPLLSTGPRGVAIDENGYLFVADTMNNAIRMVRPDGVVVTLAGKGPGTANAGWVDGPCGVATFAQPADVAVKHDMINGVDTTILLVADTGNHRIRKLVFTLPTAHQRKNSYVVGCRTICLTGECPPLFYSYGSPNHHS